MYRVAFNPALPVHAASAIHAGETVIAQDALVDWRALGVSEQTLYDWWRAGLVYHPMPTAEAQEGAGEASEQAVESDPIEVIGGVIEQGLAEKGVVIPPAQQLTRRERRALRNSSPTTPRVPRMSLDGGESAKQEDSLPRPVESEATNPAAE